MSSSFDKRYSTLVLNSPAVVLFFLVAPFDRPGDALSPFFPPPAITAYPFSTYVKTLLSPLLLRCRVRS